MRIPRSHPGRKSNTNVVNLSDYTRAQSVSMQQMMQDFTMDPDYQVPDRLALRSADTMADAQSDAKDVSKRALQSFAQFVAKPENIPMFLNALDGLTAVDRPANAHSQMMHLTHLLQPAAINAGPTPNVTIATSVAADKVQQSQNVNVLPEPAAMAFVGTGQSADTIVFSQNLGFRDMQLHGQFIGPMHALKTAGEIGLKLDDAGALKRLHNMQNQNFDGPSIQPKRTAKIIHNGQVVSVPPTRFTLDPRLTA